MHDIIIGEYNLTYTLKNNILKVSYLTTKIYNINYILSQRKSSGSTDVTLNGAGSGGGQATEGGSNNGSSNSGSGSSNSGIKIESTDEVDFWNQLDTEFQSVLNRPEDTYQAPEPIINKNAGLITVTATKRQLDRFGKYLKRLQDKVQLQVLINVKILSVTMSKGKSTGIDWRQLYSLEKVSLSADNTFDSSTGVSRLVTMNFGGSLNQVVKFLKTQGDVSSLSNPKVLTLNNQPALITSGTEYFYKLTSSTTQQGTGGGVAATTQNNNIQSVFAGVLLSITPEISDDKTITLKINPSLSETTTNISQTLNTGRDMPPDLNRRQLSSVVTVKDGNRIILGGLISTQNVTNTNKVPLLGDIPLISTLFKYEEKTKETKELVIIIEPHIIKKEKDSISLSELGYTGLDDTLLKSPSKQNKIDIR